jgi:hypothetical protein
MSTGRTQRSEESVRFISVLYMLFKKPLESIKEIPNNWFRIVLTIDLKYPPEIFPFYEISEEKSKNILFGTMLTLKSHTHDLRKICKEENFILAVLLGRVDEFTI